MALAAAFHVFQRNLRSGGIARVDEHGNAGARRYQLVQQFQPLCNQFTVEKVDAGQVAARAGQAGDKTEPDRIFSDGEHDRNRRGGRLGSQDRWTDLRRSR